MTRSILLLLSFPTQSIKKVTHTQPEKISGSIFSPPPPEKVEGSPKTYNNFRKPPPKKKTSKEPPTWMIIPVSKYLVSPIYKP